VLYQDKAIKQRIFAKILLPHRGRRFYHEKNSFYRFGSRYVDECRTRYVLLQQAGYEDIFRD
jgi:hypothetical protein